MSNGWDESAEAWIKRQGTDGDWGRQFVLDPVMLPRIASHNPGQVLDIGCGEGRLCRQLSAMGIDAYGIDPTERLIAEAKRLGNEHFLCAKAECLPFEDSTFDMVISCLSLIDIEDYRSAISEMQRVLKPSGHALIANLNSFNTAGQNVGWIRNALGQREYWPVKDYLSEHPDWVEWAGIRIQNWHRPLSAYMSEFLAHDFRLTWFAEPESTDPDSARTKAYNSAPYFMLMEWQKPGSRRN